MMLVKESIGKFLGNFGDTLSNQPYQVLKADAIGLKKAKFPNWEIFGKLLLALFDEFLLKSHFSLTAT